MDFKAQLQRDNSVFFNVAEFADMYNIQIEGKTYTVPAIVTKPGANKFAKNWDGVYQKVVNLTLAREFIDRPPIQGEMLVLNDVVYLVATCREAMGVLKIRLEVPDV